MNLSEILWVDPHHRFPQFVECALCGKVAQVSEEVPSWRVDRGRVNKSVCHNCIKRLDGKPTIALDQRDRYQRGYKPNLDEYDEWSCFNQER